MDFDIELFPTSSAAKRMIDRVSPIYDRSYVGKWLYQVMGLEMDEARDFIRSLRDQCFLERCTWGMRYWEERYGIEVDETKDLEERRRAVLLKTQKREALTPANLEDLLEELTGRTVTLIEDNANYSFTVELADGNSPIDYPAFISLVNTTKPSHLAYLIHMSKEGTLKLFSAFAMHEVKTIKWTEYDDKGVSDLTWLVDERIDALMDEDGNVLLD